MKDLDIKSIAILVLINVILLSWMWFNVDTRLNEQSEQIGNINQFLSQAIKNVQSK